jgi:hypothetical protein
LWLGGSGSLLCCLALLSSCGLLDGQRHSAGSRAEQADPKAARPEPSTDGWARFGAPLSARPAATLSEVLAAPERFAGSTVLVEGVVRRACSRKGCWMELAAGPEPTGPNCRVSFADYGFFVPKDSAGARARVEGTVEVKRVKPAHVEHLESEGGTFQTKGADGSAVEVHLVASGVELRRG